MTTDTLNNPASLRRYAIGNIRANPFWNTQRYPLHRDKIDALRESIRTTGYWENIIARAVGGGAEIAYGHNRLEALREEYGEDHEIGLIIRELSDGTMLQMMGQENSDYWHTSAGFHIGIIRTTVEAWADGRVQLVPPGPQTPESNLRWAPSFVAGADLFRAGGKPYTAKSIAHFLGLTKSNGEAQDRVHDALNALEFIELKLISEEEFIGLTTKQAGALVAEARQARYLAERRAEAARKEAEFQKERAAEAREKEQQAEAHLREKRRQLAGAKTEGDKYIAKRDVEDADRRIAQAKETIEQAKTDEYKARVKEQEQLTKARTAPAEIVQTVGEQLKNGKIGYRGVEEAAAAITRTPPRRRRLSKVSEQIRFVCDLIRRLDLIFNEARDERVKDLQQLLMLQRED